MLVAIEVEFEDDAVRVLSQLATLPGQDRTDLRPRWSVTHHHRMSEVLHEFGILRPFAGRYVEEDVAR